MPITIIYALPEEQYILNTHVLKIITIKQAIQDSGILQIFPEINLHKNLFGIFNQRFSLDKKVSQGDRIEIYRPLINNFKTFRKKRIMQLKNKNILY